MAQKTLVLKLTRHAGESLQKQMEGGPFDFRSVPHAVFSARGEGVVATLYRSGKLVVQGPEPELFVARYTDEALPKTEPSERGRSLSTALPMVGSDESGKGDYFGPLVVAACRLEPDVARSLSREVQDSKKVTDEAALRLGAALRAQVPTAIARLDPPDYNETHARVKNLNPMLADLHAQVIRELYRPGDTVLVDQFAARSVMERAVGAGIPIEQRPRAEAVAAVAAASLVAREQFLLGLRKLSEEYAIDLSKGAGQPVDRAAKAFVRLHGLQSLGRVAKLHFRNTKKLER